MKTVCVATYNGEAYIAQQLKSILPQLDAADEVVVSDDGSTDNTLSIINALGDKRIRIVKNTNKTEPRFAIDRVTHNFENALHHAKGDIIFLADQDDVWCDDKVEIVMQALTKCDLVMTDCYVTDGDLNVVKQSYLAERPFRPTIFSNILKSSFLGSCMAMRREVVESAFPFPRHGVGHDLWLGLVAIHKFRVQCVNKPTMYYRRHDATMTLSGMKNTNSLWFKIGYRLYVLLATVRLMCS